MERFLVSLAGIVLLGCAAAAPNDLEAFRLAAEGESRHVVRLPALENEAAAGSK